MNALHGKILLEQSKVKSQKIQDFYDYYAQIKKR